MASEIRVDKINSLSGVGTVTLSPTGVDIAGITTAATLRATTGIVTSLTAGSLTSLGAVSGTTGTFSAAVSGTTGTFTGDVDIADKIIHTGDTNTAIRFPEADTITFEANGFEQVRIDNDVQMFVEGNSKVAKLQLHREDVSINAGDVVGQMTFTGRDAGGAGIQRVGAAISAVASNNWDTTQTTGYSATHLDFYTQAQQGAYSTLTPRVRIDSSGRVLIGTTTEGNESADDLTLANSTNCGLSIRSGTSSNGSVFFTDATSGADEYRGFIQYQHSNDRLYFGTATTTKMYIEDTSSNGDVHIQTGDIIFGTSGKGIVLGATSNTDANTLDDYEEGTFTMHFSVEGSSNMTMQSRVGIYTKIGRTVHIIGGGTVAENPPGGRSTSAAIQFTNLPFTSKTLNTGSAGLPFPVNFLGFDSTGLGNMVGSQPYTFVGRLFDNSTAGRIIAYKGDGDQNPQNASLALVYNSQIYVMFSYVTDS